MSLHAQIDAFKVSKRKKSKTRVCLSFKSNSTQNSIMNGWWQGKKDASWYINYAYKIFIKVKEMCKLTTVQNNLTT